MSYWQDRYNSQGHEHYGAVWHITNDIYWKMIWERKDFYWDFTDREKSDFKSCLDFGCGNGYMCDMFEDYLGIDIVPELIKKNKKIYPEKMFDTVDNFSECGLKMPINQWELILCMSSLQYLHDDELDFWLEYFKTHCDNLIIQDSTVKSDDHTYYRPHEELKKICERFGFKVHKEVSTGARWLWLK